jgi:hypothetical protein
MFPLLSTNDPVMAMSLLDYLEEKPEDIEWLTDVTKRKFAAFENVDNLAIESILKEEQEKANS